MSAGGGAAGAAAPAAERKVPAEDTTAFRVRKTVFTMLHKRGYNVPDEDLHETLDVFLEKKTEGKTSSITVSRSAASSAESVTCHVAFTGSEPLNSKKLKDLMLHSRGVTGIERLIIVTQVANMSTGTRRTMMEETDRVIMELFDEAELLYDVTEHELVPEHVPLTAEEKAALLARYKVKDHQLPRIQKNDPVARFYGLQRGDVVKIVRPSETAGRYITYRIVF